MQYINIFVDVYDNKTLISSSAVKLPVKYLGYAIGYAGQYSTQQLLCGLSWYTDDFIEEIVTNRDTSRLARCTIYLLYMCYSTLVTYKIFDTMGINVLISDLIPSGTIEQQISCAFFKIKNNQNAIFYLLEMIIILENFATDCFMDVSGIMQEVHHTMILKTQFKYTKLYTQ
jgi:hypothetical protein